MKIPSALLAIALLLCLFGGPGGFGVSAQPMPKASAGKIVIPTVNGVTGYFVPKSPKYNDIRDRLQKRRLLEEFRDFLAPIQFPKTLYLLAEECQQTTSPHYKSANRSLVMCYQFMEQIQHIAGLLVAAQAKSSNRLPKGITFTEQELLAGVVAGVMLHESGHAMFDILQVPLFGRQEDAADQMSTFIAVQFSPDVARTIVKGIALTLLAIGNPPTQLPQLDPSNPRWATCEQDPVCAYSDVHGTGWQRMYNTLCLGYGGAPSAFQDFIDSGWLPADRAANCAAEYQQVKFAFERTIMPFVDPAMMKAVQSRSWFVAGETQAAPSPSPPPSLPPSPPPSSSPSLPQPPSSSPPSPSPPPH